MGCSLNVVAREAGEIAHVGKNYSQVLLVREHWSSEIPAPSPKGL